MKLSNDYNEQLSNNKPFYKKIFLEVGMNFIMMFSIKTYQQ